MPHRAGVMVQIDPAFLTGSHPLGDLELSHVRLQADRRFPWLILIPRIDGAHELEDLSPDHRRSLMEEIVSAGRAARAVGAALGLPALKLNVGQLGNVTPQLHVHVVGRHAGDAAWPGPVWGVAGALDYDPRALDVARAAARAALDL